MNLMDRKEQEEFFHNHLHGVLPANDGISIAASSYEEEWSAMRFMTAAGPIVVRINEVTKAETDVAHRTGLVARLLAECGSQAPQDYLRAHPELFDAQYADFTKPVRCPGGAEVFAWDSSRRIWPRPFYIRRFVEGPNLAVMPKPAYFGQAGEALAQFHRLRFKHYYAGFRAAAKGESLPKSAIFAMEKALEPVENLIPLVTAKTLRKLPFDPESAVVGLLSNSFFGNNVLIDDAGHIRAPDWERSGIGDLAQDFFPLKYWTIVDKRSGWYMPNARLFHAFCIGYGRDAAEALMSREAFRYLEAQWLLQRLGAASRRWSEGGLREPYPEPDFYVSCLIDLVA